MLIWNSPTAASPAYPTIALADNPLLVVDVRVTVTPVGTLKAVGMIPPSEAAMPVAYSEITSPARALETTVPETAGSPTRGGLAPSRYPQTDNQKRSRQQ